MVHFLNVLKCFTYKCFSFNGYVSKDVFSLVWVTESPPFWKRAANSACHVFFLSLFNCICL